MNEREKKERMRIWDLKDLIVARVCKVKGITIRDGNMYDKDGVPMLYHDYECVAFADNPVKVDANESVIAVYLYGDFCLELNVHDGNPNDYGESYNWGNFSPNILEQVLNRL